MEHVLTMANLKLKPSLFTPTLIDNELNMRHSNFDALSLGVDIEVTWMK